MPASAADTELFVICSSFGTEMPYPSSQTATTSGICMTPAAFTDSQKIPSAAPALPVVAKQTSSPLREKPRETSRSTDESRYSFEAHASPTARGIWPATGEMSDDV